MLNYQLVRRNVRYPRIEIRNMEVFLIAPDKYLKVDELINKHKRWIERRLKDIKEIREESAKLPEAENIKLKLREASGQKDKLRTELLNELKNTITYFGKEYTGKIKKIYVREQKTKWGSISNRRNLSFNIKLAFLPKRLVEFVVYHELLHTKIRKHDYEFKHLMREKFPDYEDIQHKLKCYSYILQKDETNRLERFHY